MSALRQLDLILRGEPLRDRSAVAFALGPLVGLNVLLAATYGACLGTFALLGRDEPEWRQVIASAFKVPLLFAVTLAVTLPSLYVFAALLGSRFRLSDLLRVVAAGTSVIVALLASFGPIVAFFAVSSTSYPFILLLNVTVFAVAGGFGVSYLYRAAVAASVPPPDAPEPEPTDGEPTDGEPANYPSWLGAERRPESGVGKLFLVWVTVFGLVGAQTGWILRPFVGSPDLPFTWFRPKQGSFFEGVGKSLESLLGSARGSLPMTGTRSAVSRLLRGEPVRLRTGLLLVAVGGAVYGAAMGSFGDRLSQVAFSAVKVPLLLAATTLLALPSFFVLNALVGLRDDFAPAVRAVVGTQAAVGVILAALAPYTLLWYRTTGDYHEATLFNGLMFLTASLSAQWVLRRRYAPLVARNRRHRAMLWAWVAAYSFVGVQMGWLLRPFVGDPARPAVFLRTGDWGNAYEVVADMLTKELKALAE